MLEREPEIIRTPVTPAGRDLEQWLISKDGDAAEAASKGTATCARSAARTARATVGY
jgi:hypothetical protein